MAGRNRCGGYVPRDTGNGVCVANSPNGSATNEGLAEEGLSVCDCGVAGRGGRLRPGLRTAVQGSGFASSEAAWNKIASSKQAAEFLAFGELSALAVDHRSLDKLALLWIEEPASSALLI